MKRYRDRKTLRFNSRLLSSMEEDANGACVKYDDAILALRYVIDELRPDPFFGEIDREQLIKEALSQ